ncbi:hypothetical protein SDJN03_08313, partial [Cucurbita argyrosperma subsp. sororia]
MPSPGHSGLLRYLLVSFHHYYLHFLILLCSCDVCQICGSYILTFRLVPVDIVLLDEVFGCSSVEKHQTISENHAMLERAVHGFQCLREAIMLAPQVWTAMFIRVTSIPENGALPPRCPTLPEPYLEHVPMNTLCLGAGMVTLGLSCLYQFWHLR